MQQVTDTEYYYYSVVMVVVMMCFINITWFLKKAKMEFEVMKKYESGV